MRSVDRRVIANKRTIVFLCILNSNELWDIWLARIIAYLFSSGMFMLQLGLCLMWTALSIYLKCRFSWSHWISLPGLGAPLSSYLEGVLYKFPR